MAVTCALQGPFPMLSALPFGLVLRKTLGQWESGSLHKVSPSSAMKNWLFASFAYLICHRMASSWFCIPVSSCSLSLALILALFLGMVSDEPEDSPGQGYPNPRCSAGHSYTSSPGEGLLWLQPEPRSQPHVSACLSSHAYRLM